MQPDLLDHTASSTVVIPFPTSKRVGHIRRTAERICNSRTDREANFIWKRAVQGMWRQMEKAGVPNDQIETELRIFHDCVQAEMIRQSRGLSGIPGGDIA
ncbi:DUF6074 family protein [Aureimonas altamirensis]|uniref:DUF6074 family protein n=1 Tax=Aureimonas altamirensis TaxID=370622 RepID=UPI0030164DC7